MTIKQLGGVFGRNPTFNDVTIEGELTFDGDIDIGSDLKVNGNLEVLGTSTFTDATLPITVNRTGGDGRHVTFEDGGSDRGGIAEHSSDLYFGTPSSGIRVSRFSSFIGPRTVDNGAATLDLGGTGSNQWRNLYLSGNVIPASGSGIDFSATAGTGTSELFDDYEEGTYTATLTPASGSITVDSNYNQLLYTKIGRMVHIQGNLRVSAISSPSGIVSLNLPFTAGGSSTSGRNVGIVSFQNIGSFAAPLVLNGNSGDATTKFYSHATGSRAIVDGSNFTASPVTILFISISYIAA